MIVSFDYEKTAAHRKEMEVTAEMVKADSLAPRRILIADRG